MGFCVSCCRSSAGPSFSLKDRLTKIAIAHRNPLQLIEGYRDEPLVSLEEALQTFQGNINHLSNQIAEAKRKCRQSSTHGLTLDESAAIYLYSMSNDSDSVYAHLQRSWEANDRHLMKPWLRYLRLFFHGVEKLPSVKGEVWQGIPYNDQSIDQLTANAKTSYTMMGSAVTSFHEVHDYFDQSRVARRILIGYNQVDGKDVDGYTAPNFPSVLLQPGLKLNSNLQVHRFQDGTIAFHFSKLMSESKK